MWGAAFHPVAGNLSGGRVAGAGGPLRACKPLPERLRGPCGWPGFAEIQRARRKASDPFLDQLLCGGVLHGGQHAEPVRQVPLPGAPLGETGLPAPAGTAKDGTLRTIASANITQGGGDDDLD